MNLSILSIAFWLRIIQSEYNIILIPCGTLVTFRQSLKKEETSHQLTSMCIGTSASMEFCCARRVSLSILVHLQKATWYLNCKIILPCNNRMFSTLPSISNTHCFLCWWTRKTPQNGRPIPLCPISPLCIKPEKWWFVRLLLNLTTITKRRAIRIYTANIYMLTFENLAIVTLWIDERESNSA